MSAIVGPDEDGGKDGLGLLIPIRGIFNVGGPAGLSRFDLAKELTFIHGAKLLLKLERLFI